MRRGRLRSRARPLWGFIRYSKSALKRMAPLDQQWITVPDESPANVKAGDNLGCSRIRKGGQHLVLSTSN
jgi:hypothetical protein